MRYAGAAALAIIASAALADSVQQPLDPSQFATQAQLSAAQSAIPGPCPSVPLADTLNGSVGSSPCFVPSNSTRPTVVQAAIVTTDALGAWSVTWAKPFSSATPYINPQPINVAGAQPYICNVASSSTTGATGKCWQTNTSTLPGVATSLLGLVLNPTSAAAAISVRVAARDLTQ